MPWNVISSISPAELAAAAFTLPLFSLFLALLIFIGVRLILRVRGRDDRSVPRAGTGTSPVAVRYVLERRVLGVGAIALIAVFAIENVVDGYLLNLADVVAWWKYTTPLFAAFLCLTVALGLILFRGVVVPERPVVQLARRTWMSFGPRAGLIGAGVALVALFATTIAAGVASSADDRGRYIYLDIPVPNVPIDALRPWFYGWAYGVPVILCLAALIVVTWVTLRSNALRPFLRPETASAEQNARMEIAAGAVHIATAGMLLALGGAFRFISRSGTISHLTIEGQGQSHSYQTIWRYADLAVAAGWLAPVMETIAFLLLLIVANRLLRSRARTQPKAPTAHHSTPEPVR